MASAEIACREPAYPRRVRTQLELGRDPGDFHSEARAGRQEERCVARAVAGRALRPLVRNLLACLSISYDDFHGRQGGSAITAIEDTVTARARISDPNGVSKHSHREHDRTVGR